MVPERVTNQVLTYIAKINSFNISLKSIKLIGERYQWESFDKYEIKRKDIEGWFANFETLATNNNIDLDAYYASIGGKPEMEEWTFKMSDWQ